MRIVVAGASGFIGRALVATLRANGHTVLRLVRHGETAADAIPWDPAKRELAPAALAAVDAVVNLAGENIAAGRWTAARRARILASRIDATSTLVQVMAQLPRPPAVLVNASAVGFYGDRGDEAVTETSDRGTGFLPDVCSAWEKHAAAATTLGIRTTMARFGVVLGSGGGALERMLPLFRAGLGGRLGDGRQWMSWIHRDDAVAAIEIVVTSAAVAGPVNVVAPEPVTNAVFTDALARSLRRPALLPVPAWALRLAFGEMAKEALLGSTRALPAALEAAGFSFRRPTIDAALEAEVRS